MAGPELAFGGADSFSEIKIITSSFGSKGADGSRMAESTLGTGHSGVAYSVDGEAHAASVISGTKAVSFSFRICEFLLIFAARGGQLVGFLFRQLHARLQGRHGHGLTFDPVRLRGYCGALIRVVVAFPVSGTDSSEKS